MVSYLCLTYLSTRPCIYCTVLLIILFATSCHWSDKCFFDLSANWFELRQYSSPLPNPIPPSNRGTDKSEDNKQDASFLLNAFNETASTLAGVAWKAAGRRLQTRTEWTGIGFGWLRSLLGVREWRVPCVNVIIRL